MFTFEIDGNVSSFTTTDRNTAWDLYDTAASDAETVTMREDGEVIATFERTSRPVRIVVADADRCPGSLEDSNYFEWIVTDRDLNLFGQCIACGRDIPLEVNLWHYYILAKHEAQS